MRMLLVKRPCWISRHIFWAEVDYLRVVCIFSRFWPQSQVEIEWPLIFGITTFILWAWLVDIKVPPLHITQCGKFRIFQLFEIFTWNQVWRNENIKNWYFDTANWLLILILGNVCNFSHLNVAKWHISKVLFCQSWFHVKISAVKKIYIFTLCLIRFYVKSI